MTNGLVESQPPKLQESLPVLNRQQRAIAASTSFGRWIAPRLLALWSHKWPVMGVLVATVLLATYGQTLVLGPRVTAVAAEQGLFLQTVVASGHVEAPYRVNIASQMTGVVINVPVAEGQLVKAGDVLIQLDDRELRATSIQAEGAVAQADARLRQIRELTLPAAQQALVQARATLVNADSAHARALKLNTDGYATRVTLDEAVKALEVARAQARSAELQVAAAQTDGSDYVLAETQRYQAVASLTSARSRLSYTAIKAPRDGILISRNVEAGNTVAPGALLMVLSPGGETQLVVLIDEKNLSLISIGLSALASADAYAKTTFPAEVFYVNPGVDLQRASVEVKLKVPEPPSYLRQDMTVSVDIEIARRADAVILPVGSIGGVTTPAPWVLKVVSGRAKKTPITLGIVSGGKAEIVSGLKAGELVVPANNIAIKDGQRVRAGLPAAAKP
jgi:HlyD family secretion protein